MEFRRSHLKTLQRWWSQPRRKPLILRGARQVGKSTLVRQFAKQEGLELYEVNLEKHPALITAFQTLDIPRVIEALEGVLNQKINWQRGLLFLDEIQAIPHAIASLRYFYEDSPHTSVICAGSLLEFTLGEGIINIPVGRIQFGFLGPASFSEFLEAKNETYLLNLLGQLDPQKGLAQSTHEKLLRLQREYLFVGGMPESIKVYLETGQIEACESVLESILNTYRADFYKYGRKIDIVRLQRVFDRVVHGLSQKIKYSSLDPQEKTRDTKRVLHLLVEAKVLTQVFHSSAHGVPLGASVNLNVFKLLFLDVGLANHMLGLRWHHILQLSERDLIHEGPLAEQFIGQSLLNAFSNLGQHEPRLHYWLREHKANNAEVDYVISVGTEVIPVEVKSGMSGSLKSLIRFVAQKQCHKAVRFDLNPPRIDKVTHKLTAELAASMPDSQSKLDGTIQFDLLSLPLYAVDELPRLLAETSHG